MAKMYSLTKIILPDDVEIPKRSVFDAKPNLAKQLQALKSARPATEAEIKAATEKSAAATGQTFQSAKADDAELIADEIEASPDKATSGAKGDPNNLPKGKSD